MGWSYAKAHTNKDHIEDHVDCLLEIYDWLLFASPLVAALPVALISKIAGRINKNGRLSEDLIALVVMMIFSSVACAVCSGQMTYRVSYF
jgi:hypothetical protein